uniref:AB hydrolase-1 domain-containing protein n=1 Tax=Acrobeloides nanus TaxID=290746 RepID=A0A914C5W6_9BILA
MSKLHIKFIMSSEIYTLTIKSEDADESKIPIVLLHGFAGGIALWATILDELVSSKHVVHAFDLLGFGSSSRPKFSTDAVQAEKEFIQSIEEWRISMKIEQMIFVGHSFGGYLGCSYAIEYPKRVRHLVLVDPWGLPEGLIVGKSHTDRSKTRIQRWSIILHPIASQFNPLAMARFLGSRTPKIMKKFRPEMEGWYNTEAIYDYNYLNNAQKPSGEVAFKNMNLLLGEAKRPMIHRIHLLDRKIPITFLYGRESWVDTTPGYSIKYLRSVSYVKIHLIDNAGHQIFAENPLHFLKVMDELFEVINNKTDLISTNKSESDENIDLNM